MLIRDVNLEDAGRIADIYRPYVENTAITFDYEVPVQNFLKKKLAIHFKNIHF